MQQKDISIILTTCNGAAYIKAQLDSILQQTLPPAQIIICDDHSDDETVAVIRTYLENQTIKLHVNKTRLGVVANFKQAAQLATAGNWLAFADQDDIWHVQKLQKLAEAMVAINDEATPALVYSDLEVIDKNGHTIAPSFWEKQQINPGKIRLETLLYGNVVTGCTMMVNYPMAQEFFNMDTAARYLHDEWLALVAYSFGRAKLLSDKLVLYRQHAHNITFSEAYEKAQVSANNELMDYISGKKRFLPHQFSLVKAFLLRYRQQLTSKQIKILERFIRLENKNYLIKRINRRIAYL